VPVHGLFSYLQVYHEGSNHQDTKHSEAHEEMTMLRVLLETSWLRDMPPVGMAR
jgi:hypothetical protein